MSISIVHYNPIEYYPPVHNLIKYLDLRLKIVVHSTYPNNVTIPNKYSGVKILRFSKFRSKTLFMRYFNFFLFTLKSFAYLLRDSPKVILYFETWSCLPVFLYKIIRPRTSILVHHHEYTSSVDIKNSPSSQLKFLYKIEKKLLRRISSSFGCVLAQTIIFLLLINSALKEKEGFAGSASKASNLSDDST